MPTNSNPTRTGLVAKADSKSTQAQAQTKELKRMAFARSLIPRSIWSSPQLAMGPPKTDKNINISIEGLPSPQLSSVLDILSEVGYSIYNRDFRWAQLYQENPDTYVYPYLLNQMVQNFPQNNDDQMGFQIHYNLYGLLPILLEWLARHKKLTAPQVTNLQSSALHLVRPPDYIIYLYLPPHKITSGTPYSPSQLQSLYGEYEWILDNTHCPYPIFKVNLMDPPERVVETIFTIFKQIIERIELEVD